MATWSDVIVLGGGIVGASTAEIFARRGLRPLLLDQGTPGHTRGSSHGDGRIVRVAYAEPTYVRLALRAYRGWEALSDRVGEPLLLTTGGLDIGPDTSEPITGLATTFDNLSIPYEPLAPPDVHRRFPQIRLEEDEVALYQPDAGVARATPALRALWAAVVAQGGRAISGVRIDALEPIDEGFLLHGRDGTRYRCARLVLAAGAWTAALVAPLGLALPLRVTEEQVAHFPAVGGIDHGVGAMPILIDRGEAPSLYALPQIEVPGVKVGRHQAGREIDPDGPRTLDDAALEQLVSRTRRRLPHLASEPVYRASCLYTITPDDDFVLDRHPELPALVIGCGFSGHGFKFGPALGEILAALALDEPPPIEIEMFSINRLARRTAGAAGAPRASGPE